ncbi:wax ester/triacylglycerol synthase domain-containing protein [Nonomuraea sp. NPDC005650]|uniref:wax ester/triacylglycerol synthase domain-containing protein n=1 Tax=Nonomuraea sp. NPDC005650 TaxID=3157045 RepID=UPI0033AC67D7
MAFASVPLTALDDFIMRGADQRNAQLHVGVLLTVPGRPPTPAVLRDYVGGRVERVPALGYRLDDDRSCWRPDSGFDPGSHVDAHRVEPGADLPMAALDLPSLDPGRPQWSLTVLHGYSPNEYTLCYRAHHMFQDGLSIAHAVEALFGRRRMPAPVPPSAADFHVSRVAAPSTPLVGALPRSLTDWGLPMRRTANWTPNKQPGTGRFIVHAVDLDTARLAATALAVRASVNQVCLAALSGALRQWTPHDWQDPLDRRNRRGLGVILPLNLRPATQVNALGNWVGLLPITLPCHEPSAMRRLHHVLGEIHPARTLRHRLRGQKAIRHLPHVLTRRLAVRCTDPAYLATAITTIRISTGLTVVGAPVGSLRFVPPIGKQHRLIAAILQHGSMATATLIADAALLRDPLTDPARLGGLWQEAIAELHTLTTMVETTTRRP